MRTNNPPNKRSDNLRSLRVTIPASSAGSSGRSGRRSIPNGSFCSARWPGAMPFSEMAAYDLLVVTPMHPTMEWLDLHGYLKFKYPTRSRAISFINLHLYSAAEAAGKMKWFYRMALSEGKVLYSRETVVRESLQLREILFRGARPLRVVFGAGRGIPCGRRAEPCSRGFPADGVPDRLRCRNAAACALRRLLRRRYRPAHANDAAAAYADDLARVVPAARSRTDLQQPDAEPAGRIPQGCAFPVPGATRAGPRSADTSNGRRK